MGGGVLSVSLGKRMCRIFNLSNSMVFMQFLAMSKRTSLLRTMREYQRKFPKVLSPLDII